MWKTENVSNFLLKGKQIYLEGRIESRSYEVEGQKKYITEVICDANSLVLLGGGAREGGDSDPPAGRRALRARRHEPGHHRRRRAVLEKVEHCRAAITGHTSGCLPRRSPRASLEEPVSSVLEDPPPSVASWLVGDLEGVVRSGDPAEGHVPALGQERRV